MSIASPRSLAVWLSLIMASASALPTADAAEAVFIRDGKPIDLFEQKGDWKQQDGGLQAAGTDARLIAGQGLGAGDFQVTVELTLLNLDRSAASLMLGDSHFGFEGSHGKLFLTGPLFGDARGLPIGDPAEFIQDGKPLTLHVVRTGDRLAFTIDGKRVHECEVTEKAIGRIGLLPWRSTMRVTQFRASGTLDKKLAAVGAAEPYVMKEIAGVDKARLLTPGPGNPRNSEGDFIVLKDGRVLFVYTHFTGGGSDHAAAHLAGRFSSDGGKTWTDEDIVVLENEGGFNVMSVSLLRLQSGEIALFYLVKNSLADCRPHLRISRDEARTWSDAVACIAMPGYNVLNNDRAVQLKSGRLVLPVALHENYDEKRFNPAGIIRCHLSDDNGTTWRPGEIAPGVPDIRLQEPGVVELKDGRLMLFCRTNGGSQYVAFSKDQGETWTTFEPSNIISPVSPATIERIPQTGDLLLVWNNHAEIASKLRGKRTPFNVAVSRDEGRTWKEVRTLEDDPNGWYCYTAMEFVDGHVLLGHCAGDRRTGGLNTTQLTRFSLDWLYQSAGATPAP